MSKPTKKTKFRLTVLVLVFVPLFTYFVSSMFSYWTQIYKNIKEKNDMQEVYTIKLEEEEELNNEINKLQDPEYIARYAREKFLYSKKGEIIIKID